MIRTRLLLPLLLASLASAGPTAAQHTVIQTENVRFDYAQVLRVTPVYQTLTATRTDVNAAVSYYGVGIENRVREAVQLNRPLMLHIAEDDQFVPTEAQAAIKDALAANQMITVHSYPGRDHAFARQGGQHYHEGDAKLAGVRTIEFFRTQLED